MRALASIAISVVTAVSASAHYVFFLPEPSTGTVKAIFSDALKPDDRVGIEKIENTQLKLIDVAGNESALKWTVDKPGAFFKIAVPGSGNRIVVGVTDFGVLQRGESKPFWLKYYPKTIFGDLTAVPKLGERVPVEIVPLVEGRKIRFQALIAGKAVPKVEISVMTPGDEKSKELTTDENGLTSWFDKSGQYGARFRFIETKSGDDKGKKYGEIRHYATLVVDFSPK